MREGDARTRPFSDARFDVVVSVATLCFSDDPLGPIREMVRVLKPGGRLVLGELGRWNSWAAQVGAASEVRGTPDGRPQPTFYAPLIALADAAGLRGVSITDAIFYPPLGATARLMAPIDAGLGRWTTVGAAFLVLSASKPYVPEAVKEPA